MPSDEQPLVGRLRRAADFERVLAKPPRSRSAHFAVHHLPDSPSQPMAAASSPVQTELSTGDALSCPPVVDDLAATRPAPALAGQWLGLVVPKRHARRSVTRTLIKRQMRAAMAATAHRLPAGLWVLRLKSPFDVKQFPSAASQALRRCARTELRQVMERAAACTV